MAVALQIKLIQHSSNLSILLQLCTLVLLGRFAVDQVLQTTIRLQRKRPRVTGDEVICRTTKRQH